MADQVEFHTGVADPIDFACRLLRKARRQGARVLVTAPASVLSALDAALWAFDPVDFVPHLRITGAADAARAELAARTPVWLVENQAATAGNPDAPRLLVNVGAAAPARPAELERLIEIVGTEPDVVAQGRGRWRSYVAAGLHVTHHPAAAERA